MTAGLGLPALRESALSPVRLLILLVIAVFAGSRRTRIAGQIRVAPPRIVPLPADQASRFAHDFGVAYAELLDAERRNSEA